MKRSRFTEEQIIGILRTVGIGQTPSGKRTTPNYSPFAIEGARRDKLFNRVNSVDHSPVEYQQLVIHIRNEVPDTHQILARRD